MYDIGVIENCKNPDSFGEICVKCNKCGRFDKEKQIEEMACDICPITHICIGAYQPTESCYSFRCAKVGYEKGYRKQSEGEWLDTGDEQLDKIYSGYKCSVCGFVICGHSGKYCSACGAKMKGGEKNEKNTDTI